ncbi:MAG: zf-HC2 domain-containing protein [Peptococcaceae bacterium]|nr:zf-HC2 domain-containing protein [Peptococcaceae bacterium]
MKCECDMIQDLIPLVKDGVASESSKKEVLAHIKECGACRELYETDAQVVMPSLNESEHVEMQKVMTYKKRIKKNKKLYYSALGVLALLWLAGVIAVVVLFMGDSYTTRDIAEYGKYSGHIAFEEEGIHSLLEIFPKALPPAAQVNDYYYYCSNGGLFDNSYQLYLVCSYEQDEFVRERERLESIEISYVGRIQKPTITDTGFRYRAVVTVYQDKDSFEYALLDAETQTIAYVYAQTMGIKRSIVPRQYRPQGFKPPQSELTEWGSYNIYRFKDGVIYVAPPRDHDER